MIEDKSVEGASAPSIPADGFRPVGHIMRDLKKVDDEIVAVSRRREALIRELNQLSEAARQYAENALAVGKTNA